MAEITSLIPELEDVQRHGSAERRAETLRRITDLFLRDASRFGPEHIELFDDVLSRLIVEIETEARAMLARRLAPIPNAPVRVVGQLARDDDIAVAGPVLLQSKRLEDDALVDIARTKGQGHLLAIAGRPEVGAAVTDVLVGRGDDDVVRNAVNNLGARFSEAGFSALVRRAEHDDALAEKMAMRPDIPRLLFRDLVILATDVVRNRLLAAARPEAQPEIRRILSKLAGEIGAKARPPRDYAAAQQAVSAMRADDRLGEPQLFEFARSGQYEETVAALAALCQVPIDTVDRLLGGERPDPVLILCKAAGFGWPTARAVINARAGTRPLSQQAFDHAFANFERLSDATARRVLRFWRVRHATPPAG